MTDFQVCFISEVSNSYHSEHIFPVLDQFMNTEKRCKDFQKIAESPLFFSNNYVYLNMFHDFDSCSNSCVCRSDVLESHLVCVLPF